MSLERRKIDKRAIPAVLSHKWSSDVLDEGYIPFPKRLLRVLPEFFSDVKFLQIVLAVVDYSRPDLMRAPSYEYLAFNAGMCVEEFKAGVQQLEEKGWARVTGPDEAVSISLDGFKRAVAEATDGETGFGKMPDS